MPIDGIGKITCLPTSDDLEPIIENMPNDLTNLAALLVFIVDG
jgi:hypothetical protein